MLMAPLTRRNILERLARPDPELLQCSAVEVKRPEQVDGGGHTLSGAFVCHASMVSCSGVIHCTCSHFTIFYNPAERTPPPLK